MLEGSANQRKVKLQVQIGKVNIENVIEKKGMSLE